MAASIFKLPLMVRREVLAVDTVAELKYLPNAGRHVWREVLHALFCVAFYAAAKTNSRRGYDEMAHLYDCLRTLCVQGNLRPFRFHWRTVAAIRNKNWPEETKADAVCALLRNFYWKEGAWFHKDADWLVGEPWKEPDVNEFMTLVEDGVLVDV